MITFSDALVTSAEKRDPTFIGEFRPQLEDFPIPIVALGSPFSKIVYDDGEEVEDGIKFGDDQLRFGDDDLVF